MSQQKIPPAATKDLSCLQLRPGTTKQVNTHVYILYMKKNVAPPQAQRHAHVCTQHDWKDHRHQPYQ